MAERPVLRQCWQEHGRWRHPATGHRRDANNPRRLGGALRAGRGSCRLSGPWSMPWARCIRLVGFGRLACGVAHARRPDVDHRRRADGDRDRSPDQAQTIQGLAGCRMMW